MNYDAEGKKALENEGKHISDWTNTSVFAFESSDCLLIHQTASFSISSPHNSPSKTDLLLPSDWHTNLWFIVFLILIRDKLDLWIRVCFACWPSWAVPPKFSSQQVPLRIRSHSESCLTQNQVSLRIALGTFMCILWFALKSCQMAYLALAVFICLTHPRFTQP